MTRHWRSSSHRPKSKQNSLCPTIGHYWKETTIATVRTCARERCRAVSRLVDDVWTTIEQGSMPVQHAQAVSSPAPVEQLGVSWSSGTLRPASASPLQADLQAGYILPTKEEERRLEQEYYHLSRYY